MYAFAVHVLIVLKVMYFFSLLTVECHRLITGKVNCSCNSGYSWSEELRQNYS